MYGLEVGLGWEGWYTLLVVIGMIVALVRELLRPDLVLLCALGLVLVGGVVTPNEAFSGFSNPAMLTVAALFVVAGGVHRTGALQFLDRGLAQPGTSVSGLLSRFMLPTSLLSACLNNTPIVAMLIPQLERVASRLDVSPSKLLIPLSYAAITGGMITLVGTSTNLVAAGLLEEAGHAGFSLFQLAWVGIPVSLMVFAYMVTVGHRLLPDTGPAYPQTSDEMTGFQFDLAVSARSPLIGKTIEEAGLRNLEDAFLIHLRRGDHLVGPVSPDEVLQEGDVLTFVGDPSMLDRLLERPGLERPLAGRLVDEERLPLFEAVVADTSSLVGKTLKEVQFRDRFQGVVVAIHRRGEQMEGGLGTIPIQTGDLLLIEAQPGFEEQLGSSREEFYLVARRDRSPSPRSNRGTVAVGLVAAMFLLAATDVLALVSAAFVAGLGMILTGCIQLDELRRTVDVPVLLVIAAALGIGQAVEASGLAKVAGGLVRSVGEIAGPVAVLAVLYLSTNLITEFITNNAAVVLMIPVALASAAELSVDPTALAVTVTIASSASFISPIGYQTNMMVMGAGGYHFRDYARVGFPLSVGSLLITVGIVQWVWM